MNVKKRSPVINYHIPDYNSMRAAVPYDIIFPEALCVDPHGAPMTYALLNQNDFAVSTEFNLDMSGNGRLHGTVLNAQAGTHYLRAL